MTRIADGYLASWDYFYSCWFFFVCLGISEMSSISDCESLSRVGKIIFPQKSSHGSMITKPIFPSRFRFADSYFPITIKVWERFSTSTVLILPRHAPYFLVADVKNVPVCKTNISVSDFRCLKIAEIVTVITPNYRFKLRLITAFVYSHACISIPWLQKCRPVACLALSFIFRIDKILLGVCFMFSKFSIEMELLTSNTFFLCFGTYEDANSSKNSHFPSFKHLNFFCPQG